ncbi:MAG: phosphatidate cytidylyltransferase [Verrucomicrobia bacterium]|nr:phosphatidate cytidylyltransferase [Verrucomicrobiota bacterium]MBS0646550.1 phosphatidate cytidylyltransferase [Verrucomicrobiota bacterium]
MDKKHHDLRQRTLINTMSTALVAVCILLAEYPPLHWIFVAAVAGFAGLALWEYYQLLRHKGLFPAVTLGIVMTVLYIFAVFYKTQSPHMIWDSLWQRMPEILLGTSFFACFVYYAFVDRPAITHIATTFLGIVYIAIPCGLIVREMYFFSYGGIVDPHSQGTWWIIYLITVTKSADMGGYFIGRFFGRKKLALRISPNKTLEGALGGLVASISMSLIVCYLGRHYGHVFEGVSYLLALWFGLIVGVLGQLGDLAESLLKRDAHVKDSNVIPGVGGILDMVDSLLFTTPVVYIFLRVLYT